MIQDELWRRMVRSLDALGEYRADVLAVLNGAVGDQLKAKASVHATAMSLWHAGVELDLAKPLTEQLPNAKPHVVLWVHGLMASDRFWDQVAKPGLPIRLADEKDVTCICVRYNSGAHISENGRALAELLSQFHRAWPVEIEELSFIAHSMGGLVSRSAIHYGISAKATWIAKLKRLFLLGVPQRGAPLEQLAHIASFTLRQIPNPWTWAISWVMRQRSAGIRDLRHGYVIDEDWMTRDPEALSLARRYPAELPVDLRTYVIAGTLTAGEHGPVAKAVGDAMVTPFSAKDEGLLGRAGTTTVRAYRVFEGVGHVRLAGDDGVYRQILDWWNDDQSVELTRVSLPLETDRLILRSWKPEDKVPFAALNADAEVMEFFPSVLNRQQSDAFADRCAAHIDAEGWGYFAVELRSTAEFIGYVGLAAATDKLPCGPAIEIAWRLKRSAWGKGLATEAATRVLAFAFQNLQLERVVSLTALTNKRSQAVMQRVGMTNTGQDFDHPKVADDSSLRRHCLYELKASSWTE